MDTPQPDPALHPLVNLDQAIHAPARRIVLIYRYVIESVNYVFLMRPTELTWYNPATYLKTGTSPICRNPENLQRQEAMQVM